MILITRAITLTATTHASSEEHVSGALSISRPMLPSVARQAGKHETVRFLPPAPGNTSRIRALRATTLPALLQAAATA